MASLKDKITERRRYTNFVLTYAQQAALDLLNATKDSAIFVLFYGGSRSGKTAFIVLIVFMRAFLFPESRHLVARLRFNHAKTSLWYDTFPKVARLTGLNRYMKWNKADWFIKFPHNGSEIWLAGLDDKERLEKILGNEYATIYLNEASQISYLALTTVMSRLAQKIKGLKNKIFIDCNPPTKRHWIYQLFFMFRDPETRMRVANPENYIQMRLNPDDNLENISEDYMELLDAMPERQKKRFKMGEFLDDVDGALWKQGDIDRAREDVALDLIKTAVAIDPAISSDPKASGETGIVAGGVAEGIGPTGKPALHGYVLEDASGIYKPHEWAKEAIRLYRHYECDCIVAEVNQGGEMVRATIHAIDPNIKVYTVRATKGKMTRAEPISALYEQGRVHHVGLFAELEEQLTTYTGKPEEKSPDRLDSLVWLLSHLMLGLTTNDIAGPSASG
jgi:hypothetical protein